MPRREEREAGAVQFVGSRLGPEGKVAFQEWRYRTTGRAIEIAEPNSFAPSDELEAGRSGFVDYDRGIPVVVPRPGARLGRPAVGVQGRASGPLRFPGSRRGTDDGRRVLPRGPIRVPAWVWLTLVLLLVVVLAWGR